MKTGAMLPILLVLFWVVISPPVRAEESTEDETAPEELLFLEVPVVVSASRKEQPITEAPVAISVISADDIRQSGALTVPDLLRSVSGVDVITFFVRDQQVGFRGMSGPLNNKLLVMIDGRSVYSDFFADVNWSLFSIAMEEIERIEVIKSPISTLYGANAYSGVINIITKTPRQLKGTEVNLAAGTRETYLGSLIHAGEWKKFKYKVSVAGDTTDHWGSDEWAGYVARGNFYTSYDIGQEHSVSLSGGRAHFEDDKFFTVESFGPITQKGNYDYLQADYRLGGFKARFFRNAQFQDQQIERSPQPNIWDVVTYDTGVQYDFSAWKWHSFIVGAGQRRISVKKNNYIAFDVSQDLWSLFGEDEVRIGENVRVTAGVRFDRHPLAGWHVAPRGAILYSPAENHTFRLSVSRAFRNPSILESYLNSDTPGAPTVVARGNADLKPEAITSYEAGYRAVLDQRLTLGGNLFYNEYSALIIGATTVAPPNIFTTFVNAINARGVGGEIEIGYLATDWLSLFANYSYQRTTDLDDNPYTVTVNEEGRTRHEVPEHKVNLGVRGKFGNGWSGNLLLHWVDGTERLIKDLASNEYVARVRPYTTVDGRVGYAFLKGDAEASLAVFNMFNDRHYEYPPGINLPDSSSEKVGRKVILKLSLRF